MYNKKNIIMIVGIIIIIIAIIYLAGFCSGIASRESQNQSQVSTESAIK
ncbi:hypothetical protein [[Clostridium] fimetarium]|nr:hypothetical protein [[Clostridium] fimetarium]